MTEGSRIMAGRIRYKEEISPIESLVNLVDVMLVFICGLLISIIIFWNVGVENMVIVLDQSQLRLVEDAEELTQTMEVMGGYGDLGTVVLDPRTGSVYVIGDKELLLERE